MNDAPEHITSLDEAGLLAVMDELGEPAFRSRQLFRWLYQRLASSWDEMTDLSLSLREELSGGFSIGLPELVERQESADGTRKYLWRMSDGVTVESVGLPEGDRLTVCFSTQAGCAMGCSFCATGRAGFTRDLGPGEIALQVPMVGADFDRRVTNAVAMGQGEPFASYDATLAALRILNSPDGQGIGARHITVSTCGIIRGIERFSSEPEQFTLAVSLHSAIQRTRDRLMPGVKGDRLGPLRAAIVGYGDRTGRRPSLEYALLEGVNDSEEECDALVHYCKGMMVHVNLIPANTVEGTGMRSAGRDTARRFEAALAEAGVAASIRAERGADIDAACGQLRQRFEG